MTELANLFVYNPSSLPDEDFLRSFVARREIAAKLIDRLAQTSATGAACHQLIVGQRGMGKTSMLRRLALATATDPELSAVLLPLSFREEQYNVHSLEVFWANCLDALGDWYDRTHQTEKAEQLDREVAALGTGREERFELFARWIAAEGRRPLLLLDNIDLIFAGLKKEQWALREQMLRPKWIVVVGGSATSVEELHEADGPLHGLFEVTHLDKLTKEELIACMRSLATARGVDGERVLRLVDQESSRIRTLHDLTGGNPRTLTLLYLLLELDAGGDVFSDLERLLDQVTVLYKARVEDLPAQTRVVLDGVALAWDPVLASEVATSTKLEVTVVSSQLDRLQKEGVVEKVRVSKTTKSAYQVSERFFNIWYLMRHGPRRQRSRLRWLTVFLRNFYTSDQLVERAKTIVTTNEDLRADGGQFIIALSEAIEDAGWRAALKNHARDEFERYARELGRDLSEIVDPSDVPRPTTASEWIRHGNLLRQHLKRAKEAEAAFLAATSLDADNYSAWFNLGSVRLGQLADPAGAIAALTNAVRVKPNDLTAHFLLGNAYAARGLTKDAKETYEKCLRLNQKFYVAAFALGDLLSESGDLAGAELYYQRASAIAPKADLESLHPLAFFAGYIVEQFDRSLRLYERLANVRNDDFVARSNILVLRHFANQTSLDLESDEALVAQHPAYGQALIRSLIAARSGNQSQAVGYLAAIFEGSEQQIFEDYRGFVLLLFREATRQGWGDIILRWMDSSGAADRHWPLRAAFDAYVFGHQRLMDVNPEVRTAATKILGLLDAPQRYRAELQNTQGSAS